MLRILSWAVFCKNQTNTVSWFTVMLSQAITYFWSEFSVIRTAVILPACFIAHHSSVNHGAVWTPLQRHRGTSEVIMPTVLISPQDAPCPALQYTMKARIVRQMCSAKEFKLHIYIFLHFIDTNYWEQVWRSAQCSRQKWKA